MKHSFLPFYLFTFLLFPLAACTTDAYDKGEGEYSNLRGDLVDMQVDASKRVTTATTDEGDLLTIANPFTTNWIQTPDTIYRAYLYYNCKDKDRAQVVSVGPVAVMRPRKEANPKIDPVDLESIWLSTNGRYLNMALLLKVGKEADGKELHQVLGVTIDTLIVNPNHTRTLHLQLYHDQGGMPQYYTQRTYASIPIEQIDADSLHLIIYTYDDRIERNISLN